MLKTIAVLTSGNDSPGMNAAARAVVRAALNQGVRVFGINSGFKGMIADDIWEMNGQSVSDIIQRGGTFLGCGRSRDFLTDKGRERAVANLHKHGIEGVVVIGGDGSMRGGLDLTKYGIKVVGIPATIENDVWGTDYTIGCDTAANTIVEAINKLRDTASAHHRVLLLEVMGKNNGWLAMLSGIAGGAEYILVPEVMYKLDNICEELKQSYAEGRKYCIIVVSEGTGGAEPIGKVIAEKTQIDTRVIVLGHIQRGGSPTVEDRMKACQLGERAASLSVQGASGVVVGFDTGKIVEIDLEAAVRNKKTLDPELIRLARILV